MSEEKPSKPLLRRRPRARIFVSENEPGQGVSLPEEKKDVQDLYTSMMMPQKITKRERVEIEIEERKRPKIPEVVIEETRLVPISFEHLKQMAVCEINNPTDKDGDISGTPSDPRLGTIDQKELCRTCNKTDNQCPGHLGMILLNSWYINPMLQSAAMYVLQSVCSSCSHVLIDRTALEVNNILSLRGVSRLKAIASKSVGKSVSCRHIHDGISCGTKNPIYKKDKSAPHIVKCTYEMGSEVKTTNEITIEDIFHIFNAIPEESLQILGLSSSKPRDWILRALPVIPLRARPHVYQGGEKRKDHLTTCYSDIIRYNNLIGDIRERIKKTGSFRGAEEKIVGATRDLYFHISHLMNNSDKKYTRGKGEKINSISDRLGGGKEGYMRRYAMGKRVDYSFRGPAGSGQCKFGEVILPEEIRSGHSVRRKVTRYNIHELTDLYIKGEIKVIRRDNLSRGWIKITDKTRDFYVLQIGDIVDRWLQEGDSIMINRQPTLHKQSFLGCKTVFGKPKYGGPPVKKRNYYVKPDKRRYLTIRINSATTTPLNADFDGDELNGHTPQTEEAELEVMKITNIESNIMDAQKNKPMIGLVYNHISAGYLLAKEDEILEDDWNDAIALITDDEDLATLEDRLEKNNVPPRSGRALFSALLPSNFLYNRKGLVIKDGVLISGLPKKGSLGPSANSIIHYLHKLYPKKRVARFITDAQFVLDYYIVTYGLTIGWSDCIANDQAKVDLMVREELELAKEKIRGFGELPENASELDKEYKESQIRSALDNVTRIGMKIGNEELDENNPLNIMEKSGAKGSLSNTSQIVGALGQQFISARRPEMAITDGKRVLPYFEINSNDVRARGYVLNNFMKGISVAALVMHMAATRVGLINTAITTSDVGSVHHLLTKVFEDFLIAYDGSVRNAGDVIFQFVYSDGFGADKLIETTSPSTGKIISFIDLEHAVATLNHSLGYDEY